MTADNDRRRASVRRPLARGARRSAVGTERAAPDDLRKRVVDDGGRSASDGRRPATHERLAGHGEERAENADPRMAGCALGPTRGEMPTRQRAKVYWRRRYGELPASVARRTSNKGEQRRGWRHGCGVQRAVTRAVKRGA